MLSLWNPAYIFYLQHISVQISHIVSRSHHIKQRRSRTFVFPFFFFFFSLPFLSSLPSFFLWKNRLFFGHWDISLPACNIHPGIESWEALFPRIPSCPVALLLEWGCMSADPWWGSLHTSNPHTLTLRLGGNKVSCPSPQCDGGRRGQALYSSLAEFSVFGKTPGPSSWLELHFAWEVGWWPEDLLAWRVSTPLSGSERGFDPQSSGLAELITQQSWKTALGHTLLQKRPWQENRRGGRGRE